MCGGVESGTENSNMADYDEEEVTRGVTVRDVKAADFIKAYAEHLKRSGKIELPAWWDVVKTASFKEYSPADPDWYYIRAASIARKVYLRQYTGVGSLKKVYGGAARKGVHRQHFQTASGGLIRHILQQLEEMKVVDKCPEGVNKGGRKITSHGQQDLDRIAGQVVRA
ncbi:hypothetical protein BBO99_00003782 [Phytophthora kernoviae]|uniref:40S ribosomal protein S19 n=2 Tax=Phytophthora kernoviae TaxID=325452 RepID=A0A3F2RSQ9_9STRA|nr:hypothetical protein G195_004363 [Phytophthora kernoviae 00238/432]KAG2527487.1 hypothetical protein JM16_003443 [Phytophthora kernoviae]KAG2528753.1 hypothetical protein JM18_003016 [Phytophthora kernoviae]RLN45080.1 hypothetical protein BBI17_003818 [Phytophthora kernoviae]RLN46889.1 hypothetical protein BBJ29_002908 [Phytophthora kernoviae]